MNQNDSKNHVDSPQVRLHIIKLSFIATPTHKKVDAEYSDNLIHFQF